MRFLVLELVEGESLDTKIAGGALPVSEALELAGQIADALAAAHEKGIVHRDLKPSNVRVTPEGRVKVLDFGLAKSVEQQSAASSAVTTSPATQTAAGTILGSPAYMSPEQARGRPVDRRTRPLVLRVRALRDADRPARVLRRDGLGLHRRHPGQGARLGRRFRKRAPAGVRRVLRLCLEKDPERRLRDAADVRIELGAAQKRPRAKRPRSAKPAAPTHPPRLTQLTLSRSFEESPVFSPDGEEIAYAADVGGVRKIFVRRASGGGGGEAVTSGPHDDIQPAWSPDGASLAFVRAREPGRKLEPGDVFGAHWGGDVWTLDRPLLGDRQTDRGRLQPVLLAGRRLDRGRRSLGRTAAPLVGGCERAQPQAADQRQLGGDRARAAPLVARRAPHRLSRAWRARSSTSASWTSKRRSSSGSPTTSFRTSSRSGRRPGATSTSLRTAAAASISGAWPSPREASPAERRNS